MPEFPATNPSPPTKFQAGWVEREAASSSNEVVYNLHDMSRNKYGCTKTNRCGPKIDLRMCRHCSPFSSRKSSSDDLTVIPAERPVAMMGRGVRGAEGNFLFRALYCSAS